MPARPLLDRQLLYLTGKGGVGKTTVAAAAALAAARRGRRTVVAEMGGQRRMPALFGVPAPPAGHEVQLAESLWSLTVDPSLALQEFFGAQLRSRSLVGVLTQSNAFRGFVDAAPGAKELVAITKTWELVQERRWERAREGYDLVVVDAPASGHGVGLLRTPRTFADIARVGPLHSQAARVREWLEDSRRTGYAAVALAEEMPVSETVDLEGRLRRVLGRDLGAVVVNAVLPRRFTPDELAALAAAPDRADGSLLAAARATAAGHAARVRGQQEQLARLRRTARAPVTTLPFVFEPELGLEHVQALSERLGDL